LTCGIKYHNYVAKKEPISLNVYTLLQTRNNHLLWRLRKSFEQRPKFQDRFHHRGSKSLSVRQHRMNELGTGQHCSVNKPRTDSRINSENIYSYATATAIGIDEKSVFRHEPDTYDLVKYPVSHGERSSAGDEVKKELSQRVYGRESVILLNWPGRKRGLITRSYF